MSTPFVGWPLVPEDQRPRPIYTLNLAPTKGELVQLEGLGYVLIDVRSIPSKVDAIEATLEGIRFGTIESDPKIFKFLELEARISKMTSHLPTPKNDENPVDKRELDHILNAIKGASDDVGKDSNRKRKADSPNISVVGSRGPIQKDTPKLVKLGEPSNGSGGGDDLPPRAA